MSATTNPSHNAAPSKPAPLEATRVTSHAPARRGNWTDLSPAAREKLGVHPEGLPEVITLNNWSPNPMKIIAANGTDMADLSSIDLSVIKAVTTTGAISLYWTLSVFVTSHGFQSEAIGPNNTAQMQVELLSAQSGVLMTLAPRFFLQCSSGNQFTAGALTTDILSLVNKATLSAGGRFWRC